MLEIKNLTITVGLKTIIRDLSFTLGVNDKLAIIGEEGNGKSTLLKAIVNLLDYGIVVGSINYKNNRIGYLEQNVNDKDLMKSVHDYLFETEEEYYNKISNLYKLTNELSISEELLTRNSLKSLSGGERVKVSILKILLNDADILLLDEPTNDLDIDTLNWLEKFINNETKPIIYVSHDEMLLERTANMILHLELLKKKTECKWTLEKITYKEYVDTRLRLRGKITKIARKEKSDLKKQMDKLNQVKNKVEHEQATISRSDPHGGYLLKKKMRNIKSQERKLENKELTEIPDYEEAINIFFDNVILPSQKEVLKLNIPTLSFYNKILANNINLEINGNKKIVIIGKNGVGKTTLLKEIYNTLKERLDITVGYMPQDYNDVFNNVNNPIEFLTDSKNKEDIAKIRSYMGNLKFTHEEMTGNIADLSGGSKAKLILLKLVVDKCNVLILDEPTRNVSPLSNPVIRDALINFNGTIISVSHDRKYITDVCDKIYELTADGLKETSL